MHSFAASRSNHQLHRAESEDFSTFLLKVLDFILQKLAEFSEMMRSSNSPMKELNRGNIITITDKKALNLPKHNENISMANGVKSDINTMQMRLDAYKMSEISGTFSLGLGNEKTKLEYEEYEINLMKVEEEVRKEIAKLKARMDSLE